MELSDNDQANMHRPGREGSESRDFVQRAGVRLSGLLCIGRYSFDGNMGGIMEFARGASVRHAPKSIRVMPTTPYGNQSFVAQVEPTGTNVH